MIKTIEALIGVSLLLTVYFLGISLSQPQPKELTELKEKAQSIILEKTNVESFRQAVLDGNVNQVKADLNALIGTPIEVQICNNLGESQADCSGSTPPSSIRNYITINYLIASSKLNFEPFAPKTLRVFLWLFK